MTTVPDTDRRRWRPNCFALAELLLGKPYERRGSALRDALREAFRDDFLLLYEDAAGRPTLVDALSELAARALRVPTIDAALAVLPEALRAAALKFPPDMLERALTAFIAPAAGLGPGAAGGRAPAALRYKAMPRTVGERLDFLDPQQGNVADCGLMSALVASAFVAPADLRQRLAASGFSAQRPAHSLAFFDAGRPIEVVVEADFPVSPIDRPVYGHSLEAGENWPALFEKAFAMWFADPIIQWRPQAPESDNIDAATYQGIAHLFPHDVLGLLWGRAPGSFTRDRFFERLLNPRGRPPLVDPATGLAALPITAWTYPTAVESGNPRAYALSETGITRNHAYAVLGVARLTDGRGQDGDFVVLRDPHGEQRDLPEAAVVRRYGAGTWKTNGLPDGRREVVLNENGVLALPQAMFDDLFQGLGWAS